MIRFYGGWTFLGVMLWASVASGSALSEWENRPNESVSDSQRVTGNVICQPTAVGGQCRVLFLTDDGRSLPVKNPSTVMAQAKGDFHRLPAWGTISGSKVFVAEVHRSNVRRKTRSSRSARMADSL